eukprot:scaffold121832_cov63-Phaeocystis_antarctica.AAC.2
MPPARRSRAAYSRTACWSSSSVARSSSSSARAKKENCARAGTQRYDRSTRPAPTVSHRKSPYRTPLSRVLTPWTSELAWRVAEPRGRGGCTKPSAVAKRDLQRALRVVGVEGDTRTAGFDAAQLDRVKGATKGAAELPECGRANALGELRLSEGEAQVDDVRGRAVLCALVEEAGESGARSPIERLGKDAWALIEATAELRDEFARVTRRVRRGVSSQRGREEAQPGGAGVRAKGCGDGRGDAAAPQVEIKLPACAAEVLLVPLAARLAPLGRVDKVLWHDGVGLLAGRPDVAHIGRELPHARPHGLGAAEAHAVGEGRIHRALLLGREVVAAVGISVKHVADETRNLFSVVERVEDVQAPHALEELGILEADLPGVALVDLRIALHALHELVERRGRIIVVLVVVPSFAIGRAAGYPQCDHLRLRLVPLQFHLQFRNAVSDALLCKDLGLELSDRVAGLDFAGEGLAGQRLHKDLHPEVLLAADARARTATRQNHFTHVISGTAAIFWCAWGAWNGSLDGGILPASFVGLISAAPVCPLRAQHRLLVGAPPGHSGHDPCRCVSRARMRVYARPARPISKPHQFRHARVRAPPSTERVPSFVPQTSRRA